MDRHDSYPPTRMHQEPAIDFRTLTRADLPRLRQWLNTPHVYEWWGRHVGPGSLGGPGDAAATAREVAAKYGPDLDHGGTTHRFVMALNGRPIGLIQWYHLRDFADYARAIGEDPATTVGLDLLVGDPADIGRGLGSMACHQFVTTILLGLPGVKQVVAGPAKTNSRSIRALAKAGFRWIRDVTIAGEPVPEAVMRRPIRFGTPGLPCAAS